MAVAVLAAAVTVFGTVTRGPVTPVCEAEKPCEAPAAYVRLTFARAGTAVIVRTDRAGRYRVRLAPGTYRVRASVGMSIAPSAVTVRGTSARCSFSIDTGIR